MYYEIYMDSLFLLNFTLNLYVLLLVNRKLHGAATRRRVLLGAIIGGMGYCLMFILPFQGVLFKIVLAGVGVQGAVVGFVFNCKSVKTFFRILENMFTYAFFTGGIFLILSNHIEFVREQGVSFVGVLAVGAVSFLFITYIQEKRKTEQSTLCRVEIVGKDGRRTGMYAVVDTGNCLVEPISGQPVSVVDKQAYEECFGKSELFRAIPYRSVGCERGILEGVEVAELHIEKEGICKVCSNVYLGLSQGALSSSGDYKMLLHPKMLD